MLGTWAENAALFSPGQTVTGVVRSVEDYGIFVELTPNLAGLAVGYWDSMDDIKRNWAIDRVFEPEIEADLREKKLKMWKKAVACAFNWAKDD